MCERFHERGELGSARLEARAMRSAHAAVISAVAAGERERDRDRDRVRAETAHARSPSSPVPDPDPVPALFSPAPFTLNNATATTALSPIAPANVFSIPI